ACLDRATTITDSIPDGLRTWGTILKQVEESGHYFVNLPRRSERLANFLDGAGQLNKKIEGSLQNISDSVKDRVRDFADDLRSVQNLDIIEADGDPMKWWSVDDLDQWFGGIGRSPDLDPNWAKKYPDAPITSHLNPNDLQIHHATPKVFVEYWLKKNPNVYVDVDPEEYVHHVAALVLSKADHKRIGDRIAEELAKIIQYKISDGENLTGNWVTEAMLLKYDVGLDEYRTAMRNAYNAEYPDFSDLNDNMLMEVLDAAEANSN
ncbi:MAG: hypothetical protein MI744_14340, partial [Pseudomonadales bacterium]|nr:hypothetical protein [Pseudomonadales bacterium]